MHNDKPEIPERRRFFQKLAIAGGAGALMAATGPLQAEAGHTQPEQKTGKGYRLTEHVAAYYRSLRV